MGQKWGRFLTPFFNNFLAGHLGVRSQNVVLRVYLPTVLVKMAKTRIFKKKLFKTTLKKSEKIKNHVFSIFAQKIHFFSVFDQFSVQKSVKKPVFDPFFGTCLVKAHAEFDHEKIGVKKGVKMTFLTPF